MAPSVPEQPPSPPTVSGASLFERLKRRGVVRVATSYGMIAWLLVQMADVALQPLGMPESVMRVIILIAAMGFPVALVLAWFFELTPDGVVRDALPESAARPSVRGLRRYADFVVIGVLVIIVAIQAVHNRELGHTAAERIPVIAVLPLENLGADPANVAFVSGTHDTLITQIAKVPGLSVISRSSVLQFEGKKPTIHEIAEALHVGAVLEGSVQRNGNRLRIQAQLIDAATDTHLWAETYDRNSDDLFAVQSEIAQAVAEQLRIHLSSGDAHQLAADLTSNPQAYEHYVLGRSEVDGGDQEAAIRELVEAVTLDPRFAVAHAQLSLAYTWLAFTDPVGHSHALPLAKESADRAIALDPTLPEAHLALAVYHYRGVPDIDLAAREFEKAIIGLPNDAAAHRYFGFLRRWQGRWEEAIALFARAAELDPQGGGSKSLVDTLAVAGRRDEALRVIASARKAQPENLWFVLEPGILAVQFDCDLHTAEDLLNALPSAIANQPEVRRQRWFLALQTGDFNRAVEIAETFRSSAPEGEDSDWLLGSAYLAAGRPLEAEPWLRKVLATSLKQTAFRQGKDSDGSDRAWLAVEYAMLGETKTAIEQAHRSLAEMPQQGAAMQRQDTLLFIAAALALAGDPEQATQHIAAALEGPGMTKANGIWCDPLLGPSLRAYPRFRSLMAEHGADISIDPHRPETWPRHNESR